MAYPEIDQIYYRLSRKGRIRLWLLAERMYARQRIVQMPVGLAALHGLLVFASLAMLPSHPPPVMLISSYILSLYTAALLHRLLLHPSLHNLKSKF